MSVRPSLARQTLDQLIASTNPPCSCMAFDRDDVAHDVQGEAPWDPWEDQAGVPDGFCPLSASWRALRCLLIPLHRGAYDQQPSGDGRVCSHTEEAPRPLRDAGRVCTSYPQCSLGIRQLVVSPPTAQSLKDNVVCEYEHLPRAIRCRFMLRRSSLCDRVKPRSRSARALVVCPFRDSLYHINYHHIMLQRMQRMPAVRRISQETQHMGSAHRNSIPVLRGGIRSPGPANLPSSMWQ